MEVPRVPVAATILAGGLGRRMGGRPKAALQIGGVSLLERLIAALRGAGVPQVSVVLGAYPETLLPLAQRGGARVLSHGRCDTSLTESQRLALKHHLESHGDHDLMLVLADLPLLTAADISLLLEAWRARPSTIHAQMPVVEGVRGHPLLLSAKAVRQVQATRSDQGVRDWLGRHPHLVKPFLSERRAYVTDLDTPDDLAALTLALAPQPVCWPCLAA